ncbi:MAG: HEAT repeat domain-containing protein [Halolamina sp.]
MTDGDDANDGDVEVAPDERLDDAEAALEAAETEADLDDVEATLEDIAADIEATEFPEPDDDEEEDPGAELEDRLSGLEDDLEAQRGPYAEDVVDELTTAQETLRETRWTEDGVPETVEAVNAFRAAAADVLAADFEEVTGDAETLADAVDEVAETVADAGLDADDDAEGIDALLTAADDLADGLDAAEEWDDLETHEQLRAQGFYDVLGHTKDFPPEWAALKEHEKRGNVEMVLLALEELQSEFMEENALDALVRMNHPGAYEAMFDRASKRDNRGIEILGKMGPDAADAVETLIEYVDEDSDPQLQKVTFRALGEIGDEAATQPLANQLEADNDNVRPLAARALGLVGDTRAVEPLVEALSHDHDNTRAAAAWALRQIGTREALEAVADHDADDAFIVETEVEKAADTLDAAEVEPAV